MPTLREEIDIARQQVRATRSTLRDEIGRARTTVRQELGLLMSDLATTPMSMAASTLDVGGNAARLAQSGVAFGQEAEQAGRIAGALTLGSAIDNPVGSVFGLLTKGVAPITPTAASLGEAAIATKPERPVAEAIKADLGEFADTQQRDAQAIRGILNPASQNDRWSPQWIEARIGEMIPQLVGSLGATAAGTALGGPVGGLAAGSAITFGTEAGAEAETIYQARKAQGAPDDEALAEAFLPSVATGLINAGIEQAGVERLLRTGLLKGAVRQRIIDFLGSAGSEGLQEVGQGTVSRGFEALTTGNPSAVASPDAFTQSLDELGLGIIAGGGSHAAVSAPGMLRGALRSRGGPAEQASRQKAPPAPPAPLDYNVLPPGQGGANADAPAPVGSSLADRPADIPGGEQGRARPYPLKGPNETNAQNRFNLGEQTNKALQTASEAGAQLPAEAGPAGRAAGSVFDGGRGVDIHAATAQRLIASEIEPPDTDLVRFMRAATEKRGVKLRVASDPNAPIEGLYNPGDGSVFINLPNVEGKRGVFGADARGHEVLVEELAHHLDDLAPDTANELRAMLGAETLSKASTAYVRDYARQLFNGDEAAARERLGVDGVSREALGRAMQMALGASETRAKLQADTRLRARLRLAFVKLMDKLTRTGAERVRLLKAYDAFWNTPIATGRSGPQAAQSSTALSEVEGGSSISGGVATDQPAPVRPSDMRGPAAPALAPQSQETASPLQGEVGPGSSGAAPSPTVRPKVTTAKGRFSKKDVAARMAKVDERFGVGAAQDFSDDVAVEDAGGNDQVSFSFDGPLPAEILRLTEGRPELRMLLRANVKGGTGADSLATLGDDRYLAMLERFVGKRKRARAAAVQVAAYDPEAALLAWLDENRPEKAKALSVIENPEAMEEGTRVKIFGQRFQVQVDGADVTLVSEEQDLPLSGLAELPIDVGSFDPPKGRKRPRVEKRAGDPNDLGDIPFSVAPAEDSAEFKRWFGKSMLKNEDGSPRVLYHGTKAREDFSTFNTSPDREMGTHVGTLAQAGVFADATGETHRPARIFPVFVRLENPIRLKDFGEWSGGDVYKQIKDHPEWDDARRDGSVPLEVLVREFLESQGYDGIVYLNRREGFSLAKGSAEALLNPRISDATFRKRYPGARDSYIVFDPSQVKSATGNRGTFDPSNPDIRFSVPPAPGDVKHLAAQAEAEVARGQTRTVGRPELANPVDPEAEGGTARRLVDAIDEARKRSGVPITKADAVVLERAQKRLQDDYAGEVAKLLKMAEDGKLPTDEDVAVAKVIVADASIKGVREGDEASFARAIEIANAYRDVGAEQARAFRQRVDPWLTPAERARQYMAEVIMADTPKQARERKAAKKAKENATGEEAKKAADKRLKALDAKKAKVLVEIHEKLKAMGIDPAVVTPALFKNQREAARIAREISIANATWGEKGIEYWYNSILSGTRTQSRNVIGNLGYGLWESLPQRLIEATINLGVGSKDAATFGELKPMMKAIGPSLARAFVSAGMSWSTESPVFEDRIRRAQEIKGGANTDEELQDSIHLTRARAKIGGKVGRVVRIPTRALRMMDEAFKTVWGTLEAHAIAFRVAKAEGLKGDAAAKRMAELIDEPASIAWAGGLDQAKRLAFQSDLGVAREIVSKIRDVPVIGPVSVFIAPFIGTPLNIFRAAYQKSPVAVVNTLYRSARQGAVLMKWDKSGWTYTRNEVVRDLANNVVAFGTLFALWGLTGDPDDKDDEPWITGSAYAKGGARDHQYRSRPPLSVRLPGVGWVSYAGIEPFATMFGSTIDAINGAKKAKDGEKFAAALREGLVSMKQQVRDKTFFKSVSDLMTVLGMQEGRGGSAAPLMDWASDFAASWVPNIVRQAGGALDDKLRDRSFRISEERGALATFGQRTLEKAFPFGSNRGTPRVDFWGDEISTRQMPGPATDFVYRMLIPLDVRRTKPNEGDRFLRNWNNLVEDDPAQGEAYWPRVPRDVIVETKNGKKSQRRLSDREYHDYLVDAGTRAKKKVDALIRVGVINPDDPTPKAKRRFEKAIEEAREEARKAIR